VVSKVGAFSELGDAVAYFTEPETPDNLADLILNVSRDDKLPEAARRYCESKSPAQFCATLFNEISAAKHGQSGLS
jgi:hypothetical protein